MVMAGPLIDQPRDSTTKPDKILKNYFRAILEKVRVEPQK